MNDMVSDLISHTDKQTQYTQGPTDWHVYEYMLTSPVTCTQQLPVLHWMNNLLIKKRGQIL